MARRPDSRTTPGTGPLRRKKKRSAAKPTTRSAVHATAQSQPFTNLVRLQKVLAAAGIGSRRECETLISEGRVAIGDRVVTQLGTRVDPIAQKIYVDGEPLPQPKLVYFMVNKPQGVVSTNRDEWGRTRVTDMVPDGAGRVFTVGRLDMNSEGLILLTNDGALANRLTHPRYGVEKTYHVQVAGRPEPKVLETLKRGVYLAEGIVQVENVKIKSHHKQSTILEMVLTEGRNREIRRMLAGQNHKVQFLRRVAIGPLKLGELPPDTYRPLSRDEVEALREVAEHSVQSRQGGTRKKRFTPAGSRAKKSNKPAAARKHTKTQRPKEEFYFGGAKSEAAKSEGAVIGDESHPKKKSARHGGVKKSGTGGKSSFGGAKTKRSFGKKDGGGKKSGSRAGGKKAAGKRPGKSGGKRSPGGRK